jgi:hypothetical protein
MPGLVPGIHFFFPFPSNEEDVDGRDEPGHDDHACNQPRYAFAASPTISGCRASDTAGDIRITSACAPKIATAR